MTTRAAAELYGLQVNRHGMCVCPFHNDKNPSMKVDTRFHCFGCQADGDVIDFTARLYSLSPKEAALKLASDFGISYDAHQLSPAKPRHPQISETEILNHQVSFAYGELADYRHKLTRWAERYAPQTQEDDPHPLFLESVLNLDRVEYQLDVLLSGTDEEKREVLEDLKATNQKKEAPQMEPVVNTPVYHETAAYAREHGELEQYRNSHWTNIACKKDIEDAIARNFDGMHLNKECVNEVLDRYGSERVSLVLAATVQTKAWDGRFSNTNKDWAFSVDIKDTDTARGFDRRDEYAVGSHPAVLDGFINLARKEMKERERPSLREQLQEAQMTAPKLAARKRSVPER